MIAFIAIAIIVSNQKMFLKKMLDFSAICMVAINFKVIVSVHWNLMTPLS